MDVVDDEDGFAAVLAFSFDVDEFEQGAGLRRKVELVVDAHEFHERTIISLVDP